MIANENKNRHVDCAGPVYRSCKRITHQNDGEERAAKSRNNDPRAMTGEHSPGEGEKFLK